MAEHTPIPAGAYERLARQLRADMQRKQFLEQMQAVRNAEDMVGRHSVGPDTRRQVHPDLISNALLAGTLGGAMSASGLPSVGLRAGLIGGGLTDATLNAGNPEGGAEISGALAAAGALGRHSIPAALAALGASSSEASGMPFHSWMKRLNALNKVEPTAMYVNPTNAELLGMMRDARETYPTSPTVRLLRDQRSNDVYGVEGSSILHDDMRKHLKLKYEFSPGSQGSTLPELDTELHFLKSLPRLAGGGAIKRLGKAAMSAFDELRPSSVAPQGALSVVKNKGGNWLAGSVEDALKGLKPLPQPGTGQIHPQLQPISDWIENQLTKYVKTRMASPDDEVRRLAEQGVLHVDPEALRNGLRLTLLSGDVPEKLGKSVAAQRWENITDRIPRQASYLDHLPMDVDYTRQKLARKLEEAGGKFALDNPDALAYGFNRGTSTRDLGFDHLIDELSNALNPNSGLPAHLQLNPEAVKQMSMEKAVRRVADINAWRAAQKAEANRKLAEQASIVREYAENNPKGLRWVELKAPSGLPEGYRVERTESGVFDVVNPKGDRLVARTPEEAEKMAWGEVRAMTGKHPLADQLKYEGDTMGHCVGGYCDDVLEGRSRIFSLRDANGEPHVTVEVAPAPFNETPLSWFGVQPEQVQRGIAGDMTRPSDIEKAVLLSQEWAALKANPGAVIKQIKGKQNRVPNPEYLPFVQDFVRNSPLGQSWSDVGDLQNTGLYNTIRTLTPAELKQLEGSQVSPYMTMEEIKKLREGKPWTPIDTDPEFASGGSVQKPTPTDNFQAIIAALEQELTHA